MYTTRIATAAALLGLVIVIAEPATGAQADSLCGTVLDHPGQTLVLGADLACDGTAFTITADNVRLDLNGHVLSGTSAGLEWYGDAALGYPEYSAGVRVTRATNAVVTNGTIRGFDAGVLAEGAGVVTVDAVSIDRPQHVGVWAAHSRTIRVINSDVRGIWERGGKDGDGSPDHGVGAVDTTTVAVENTDITQMAGSGVFAERATTVSVGGAVVWQTGGNGLWLWDTAGNARVTNSSFSYGAAGVEINHVGGEVALTDVSATGNGGLGVHVADAPIVVSTRSTAFSNSSAGVWLESGIDGKTGAELPFTARLTGTDARHNVQEGIALTGKGRWTLTGNVAVENTGDGISLMGGQSALSTNVAHNNGAAGIAWRFGAKGSSTQDRVEFNRSHGMNVGTESDAVRITDLSSRGNSKHGLFISDGTATVYRGTFTFNTLDGVRAAGGRADLTEAYAYKNGGNGVAFLAGSSGSGRDLTSNKNARYGLCRVKGIDYTDYPPHRFVENGRGATGSVCDTPVLGSPGRP